VSAAAARLALTERQVRNDVSGALAAYQSYARRGELLAAPLSAEAADLLGIAQIAYEAGEMDLIELLDAADALREAQLLEARFRADFWNSYFDLERALGGFDGATDTGEGA
jgi:outer membrane protein TolC